MELDLPTALSRVEVDAIIGVVIVTSACEVGVVDVPCCAAATLRVRILELEDALLFFDPGPMMQSVKL